MDVDTETSLPTCYRHPDRETRLSCSSCGRPTCVDCVRSAAVGQKCLECAAPDSRARVITAEQIRGSARAGAPVAMAILGVCVGLFVLGFAVPGVGETLFLNGAQSNAAVAGGQWYRLFTSAFLHADLTHVLFNMWALYVFGPPLERQAGSVPFAALYVSSALAGGAAYYLLGGDGFAVGASGAIFGLFGAWIAASLRTRHTLAGRASLRQLLTLLAINLALPLLFPRIAWQAHAGGLVAGFLIAMAWGRLDRQRGEPVVARALVAAVVGAVALAAVLLL